VNHLRVWQRSAVPNKSRKLPPVCSHEWIDLVDLAMHRAIARKIRREPKLYNRAWRTLARWEKAKRACPPPLREWKRLLRDHDMNTVLRILTRQSDEGQRLRSTAPFCGILSQRELEAIWARYDQK
jgi:hypothetical protein